MTRAKAQAALGPTSYLADALRQAAAGHPVRDREDLELAAATVIDRLTQDLATALGVPLGALLTSRGLNHPRQERP